MIDAKEAQELAKSKLVKVWSSLDQALDSAILKAIEEGKNKVDIALWYKDCREDDKHVEAYLIQLWYSNVKISSDYPWYNESYEGKTFIKFSF